MRLPGVFAVAVLSAGLAACGSGITDINARPAKHYQEQVNFKGRVARMQRLSSETLLEVEDTRGSRILVRAAEAPDVATGDWIRVRGILVPEARVGDRVLYDVVQAERIGRARRPRLRNLF
jgi:hypothetical protein